MGSTVDATCKGCQYLGSSSFGKICNYSSIVGHMRGCHAGAECTKYSGPPRQKPDPIKEATPKAPPPPTPHRPKGMSPEEAYARDQAARKRRIQRNRERLQGRQKAAIVAYKEETGMTNAMIAYAIGVKESRVQRWCNEYIEADWELLSKVGIEKPEGID